MTHQTREVAEILSTARGLVENGWCQGKSQLGNKYCMTGAVAQAANGHSHLLRIPSSQQDALWLLMKHLPWQPIAQNLDYDWAPQVIPQYNDHKTTTQADVLDVFDKALAEIGHLE